MRLHILITRAQFIRSWKSVLQKLEKIQCKVSSASKDLLSAQLVFSASNITIVMLYLSWRKVRSNLSKIYFF